MDQTVSTQRVVGRPREIRTDVSDVPRIHCLERGGTNATVSDWGTGSLEREGMAVTRWTGDLVGRSEGTAVYLRDLDTGKFWSLGYRPVASEPDAYEAWADERAVYFRRRDHEIAATMTVSLSASGVEVRRIAITNLGWGPRRIEVTSYLEWVLQDVNHDNSHPAFSKLFVETEWHADRRMVLARRRRREPMQQVLVGAHWIADLDGSFDPDGIQSESSRSDFVGRGRDLVAPHALALSGEMSATFGPVLDPAASLRASFFLGPNESATIALATAAATSRDELLALVDGLSLDDDALGSHGESHLEGFDRAGLRRFDPAHRRSRGGAQVFQPLARSAAVAGEPSRNGKPLESLAFDNGLGGFTAAGDEYVIRLKPQADGALRLPPVPWSHVVASPEAGFIATETGAGSTWTVNSRENRLTQWANDPVSDPPSEALYLRDRQRREFWSPTPGPATAPVEHEVRYGFGYVEYRQQSAGLRQTTTQFVPADGTIKITRLKLESDAATSRELDLVAYAQLTLGNASPGERGAVRAWFDDDSQALFAVNPKRELAHRIAFAALVAPDCGSVSYALDRAEFVGRRGGLDAPAAVVESERLSGAVGDGADPCFALQTIVRVAADSAAECLVLLGEAENEEEARALIARYSTPDAAASALAAVRSEWRRTFDAVQIDTPSKPLNVLVNGWLPYQNMACRLWGRAAYYQSGGAFGYRDQLQDAAALVYHRPELSRRQILIHAAHQFAEGDVLHWWHPRADRGMRTRFSDDLLWLPLLAAEYAATTGDGGVWDEVVPFVAGPQLDPGEGERFFRVDQSPESASLYEHCCRAADRSLAVGAHGLPLMGTGDWNDGMSRVGVDGRGESVWMGFFLHKVLDELLPVCRARGDESRVAAYESHQARLCAALDDAGWDGGWFRRAYFDCGTPLGTATASECQIDALVQAWAVLSGAADPAKQLAGVEAVEQRLVDDDLRMIRLLTPPFDRADPDPGYIRGYVPGVRENGGQYTHGVLWFVRAVAELGRGSRAVELLEMLTPIAHASTPADVELYKAEPYVVAADVYGGEHAGRAGWTWYTGSAGWMLRVAVETILGLRVRGGRELVLNPTIASTWPSCRLTFRVPGGATTYEITINNPSGRERGVRTATLDDKPARVEDGAAYIPLVRDGRNHRVSLDL